MIDEIGLATNRSDLAELVSKIAEVNDGVSASGATLTMGTVTVSFAFRDLDEEQLDINPSVTIYQSASSTALLGDNANAKGLAWQLIGSEKTGDLIVKFAHCASRNKLDIIKESFQSWSIAAYTEQNGIHLRSLMAKDLLHGQSYGGFMVHKMNRSGTGISIFDIESKAPIFTWIDGGKPLSGSEGNAVYKYTNTNGLGCYAEHKQRFRGLNQETFDSYRLWSQEPNDRGKSAYVDYAVLAPISCPSTSGDYAKTARYLLQGPHMYNPFDGSQFIVVDGDGTNVFYSDYGVCACMTGDSISNTGLKVPSPNTLLLYDMGDFEPRNAQTIDPGLYGEFEINI